MYRWKTEIGAPCLPGAHRSWTVDRMCRSIKTLRPPFTDEVGPDDVHAAALQYVRKIAGMRAPSAANTAAFDAAVEHVASTTQDLLDALVLRPVRTTPPPAEPRPADLRLAELGPAELRPAELGP